MKCNLIGFILRPWNTL